MSDISDGYGWAQPALAQIETRFLLQCIRGAGSICLVSSTSSTVVSARTPTGAGFFFCVSLCLSLLRQAGGAGVHIARPHQADLGKLLAHRAGRLASCRLICADPPSEPTMPVTCFIRYLIDPFQRKAGKRFTDARDQIIQRCGGNLEKVGSTGGLSRQVTL
jgi:hypothetical protein